MGRRSNLKQQKFFPPILLLVIIISGCTNNISLSNEGYSRAIPFLGSFLEIKVYDKDDSDKKFREKIKKTVNEAITIGTELEKKFSIYQPRSEINILNMAKRGKVSDELYDIIKSSNEISLLTEGEFDPTVAPVMKKAGFYSRLPKEVFDSIPDVFYHNHWKDIELARDNEIILHNDAWLDLSGIATGYIVDKMKDFLLSKGLKYFLINASGDIYATTKENGGKISIGIREPGSEDVVMALNVSNESVVTSGDYENWLIDGKTGKAVTHIVNPEKGEVLDKELAGFTVIAPNTTMADGLSTGMMAMGAERAINLANRLEGVGVIVAAEKNGKIDIKFSKGVEEKYVE